MALQNDFQEKSVDLQLKSLDDTGVFEGFASVYGNIDYGGDVVLPGAFKKSIEEKPSLTVLWEHDTKHPIAKGVLEDTMTGLKIHGQLDMADPMAQFVMGKLKGGFVNGLSIGYQVVKDGWEAGKRQLKEVKVHEVSIVTLPQNDRAIITSFKAGRKFSADSIAKLQSIINSLETLLEDAGVPDDVGETPTPAEAASKSVEPVKGHSELTLAVETLLRA
jgi:HK97 family phage prohead protease